MANPDLSISIPWYRLLITLWNRTGGATSAGFLSPTTPGGSGQPQTLGASPFGFTATSGGQLLVSRKYTVGANGVRTREAGGETVEFSRDGGATFYFAATAPALLPISYQDQIRISWFTPGPPTVIFFPIAQL